MSDLTCDECLRRDVEAARADYRPNHSETAPDIQLYLGRYQCLWCRTSGISRSHMVRIGNVEFAKQLEEQLKQHPIKYIGLSDHPTWLDDEEICAVIEFELNDHIYMLDLWWTGVEGYGAFTYAHDSASARAKALESIRWWIQREIATGF
jgi:hypothetical protein